jgi:hypothetical protein
VSVDEHRSNGMPVGDVTVVGRQRKRLGPAVRRELPTVEMDHAVRCASGERTTGRWRGVAVALLLSMVDAPDETTHLFVEGRDGYRVGVELRRALGGLLADERDGAVLAATGPRFVAPEIDGEQAVSDVVRVETAALAPGESPVDREVRDPDD